MSRGAKKVSGKITFLFLSYGRCEDCFIMTSGSVPVFKIPIANHIASRDSSCPVLLAPDIGLQVVIRYHSYLCTVGHFPSFRSPVSMDIPVPMDIL